MKLEQNLKKQKDKKTTIKQEEKHQENKKINKEHENLVGNSLIKNSMRLKIREFFGKIRIDFNEFEDIKIRLFKLLHLLNEEFRLSINFSALNIKLSFLLHVYAGFLDCRPSALYKNYYLNLFPQIILMLKKNDLLLNIQAIKKVTSTSLESLPQVVGRNLGFSDQLDFQVFDVIEFLNQIFLSRLSLNEIKETVNRFPYIFKNYYRIIKVIFLLFDQKMECDFFKNSNDKHEPIENDVFSKKTVTFLSVFQSLSDVSQFQASQHLKTLKEFQIAQTKTKNYNKIFIFMLREKMSFAYIESLIDSLVYFYKSILRLLRKEISNFLIEGHFQKSAYKLLMREDLYANKFLHPSQHIKQLHTDNFSTHHLRHQTNSKLSEVSLQGNLTFGQNEISSNKISTFWVSCEHINR